MYRYEGKTANEKFDEFDNGKTSLADAKNDPAEFESSLSEIKKGNKKRDQGSKKTLFTTLKYFIKKVTKLLNFMMITRQWYLKQNIKQLNKQDLKY